MINFIWIVLIVLVSSVITAVLVVMAGYLCFDSLMKWYIKRKMPKDLSMFLDGGKDLPTNEKEVQIQDGQFREFDRLREIAIGERTAKVEGNKPRFISNESRDDKINAIASEHIKPDTRADETW